MRRSRENRVLRREEATRNVLCVVPFSVAHFRVAVADVGNTRDRARRTTSRLGYVAMNRVPRHDAGQAASNALAIRGIGSRTSGTKVCPVTVS